MPFGLEPPIISENITLEEAHCEKAKWHGEYCNTIFALKTHFQFRGAGLEYRSIWAPIFLLRSFTSFLSYLSFDIPVIQGCCVLTVLLPKITVLWEKNDLAGRTFWENLGLREGIKSALD